MFDGKHISRRAINLGSKTKKQPEVNNARLSVLQDAQQKRELRQLQAKRHSAAILLQRYIRGYLALQHVARDIDEILLQQSFSFSWIRLASILLVRISKPLKYVQNKHLEALTCNVLFHIANAMNSTEAIIPLSNNSSNSTFIVSKLIESVLQIICRRPTDENMVQIFTIVEKLVSQNPPFHVSSHTPLYWTQILISPFYPFKTNPYKPPLISFMFQTLRNIHGSNTMISNALLQIAGQACTFLSTCTDNNQPSILPQIEANNLFAMLLFTSPPNLLRSFLQRAFASIEFHPTTQLELDASLFYLQCARLYFGAPLALNSRGEGDLQYQSRMQAWFSSMMDSYLRILLPSSINTSTNSNLVEHFHHMIRKNSLNNQVVLLNNVLLVFEISRGESSLASSSSLLSYSALSTLLQYLSSSFITGPQDWNNRKDYSNRICTLILASSIAQDGGVGGKTWNVLQSYALGQCTVDSNRLSDKDTIMIDAHDENYTDSDDDDEEQDEVRPKPVPIHTQYYNPLLQDNHSNRIRSDSQLASNNKMKPMESFGRKLSKEDLRTSSKLDSMYRLQLNRDRLHAFQYLDYLVTHDYIRDEEDALWASNVLQTTCIAKIAMQLGEGDLLMKLVSFLLMSSSMTYSDVTCFSFIMSRVLSSCSGMQSRSNGPQFTILSKFAFDFNLLETLWKCIISQGSPMSNNLCETKGSETFYRDAMSSKIIFCDLLSHYLLGTDDDDFQKRFLIPPNKTQIGIVDVIGMLKDFLWDAYWIKPVTQDVLTSMNDDPFYYRFRLFLSGTKLFNDLYERWGRLVNNTHLCDESLWWFTSLPIHDDSGAVSKGSVRADGFFQNNDASTFMEEDDVGDIRVHSTQNNSQEESQHEALASCFKDPRLARILTAIPQVVPFDRRAKMFHSLLNEDKEKRQTDEIAAMHALTRAMFHGDVDESTIPTGRENITIRRDALYKDSKDQLSSLGKRLRRQLKVTFVNQLGANEAGIDGGGVFREFLDDLIKDAFNPSSFHEQTPPLFTESPTQLLCINLAVPLSQHLLQHYEFCGQIIGKAIYESVLVEAQFCLPFLNQLLGKQNSLDDLKNMDPDFHRHLVSLRNMKKDEVESLGLTFELGSTELIPNGSAISVTKDNVIRYIHLVAHRRLNQDSLYQTRAFLKGFRDLIPAPWVRLFSARELQKVIGGDDSIKGIDVDGLKAVMQYSGGYHPSQPIIHWFWEIINEMNPPQQRKFLKFMTSCSRQPLLGFQSLVPLPCIQQIRMSESDYESLRSNARNNCRLPTSSTCMNLLKLPNYPSKELLRSKLVYAIESGAGFELS